MTGERGRGTWRHHPLRVVRGGVRHAAGSSAVALGPAEAARSVHPAGAVEGETHCEWCGAEYPVPEGGD